MSTENDEKGIRTDKCDMRRQIFYISGASVIVKALLRMVIPVVRNIKNDILDVAMKHCAEPVEGIHGKIVIVFQPGDFRWI
jgi:hypothetical protein